MSHGSLDRQDLQLREVHLTRPNLSATLSAQHIFITFLPNVMEEEQLIGGREIDKERMEGEVMNERWRKGSRERDGGG